MALSSGCECGLRLGEDFGERDNLVLWLVMFLARARRTHEPAVAFAVELELLVCVGAAELFRRLCSTSRQLGNRFQDVPCVMALSRRGAQQCLGRVVRIC